MSRFEVQRNAKLRQLAAAGPFVAASLCQVKRRCGNPRCRCAQGQPHRAHVLTRKVRGKTRTVHVPKELLQEVRAWVREYARVKRLVAEVSEASLDILHHRSVVRRAAAVSRRKSPR
jgi:hypothetical protein